MWRNSIQTAMPFRFICYECYSFKRFVQERSFLAKAIFFTIAKLRVLFHYCFHFSYRFSLRFQTHMPYSQPAALIATRLSKASFNPNSNALPSRIQSIMTIATPKIKKVIIRPRRKLLRPCARRCSHSCTKISFGSSAAIILILIKK